MTKRPRNESGFALILALLALMLLTFLGLTLATTTSTELQIAQNYRWSQQAFYNAEAGMEIGKRALADLSSWAVVLPPQRLAGDTSLPSWPYLTRTGASGEDNRSFENEGCDQSAPSAGFQGYGVVLDPLNTAFPYQNVYQFLGESLQGTFTLWVRRARVFDQATGQWMDDAANNTLIMVSEGTAPYTLAGAASRSATFAQRNRAVRILEATLQLISTECDEGNQEAGGPEGSGASRCVPSNTGK